MKKNYILSLLFCAIVLLFQNIDANEINFLGIADLKGSESIADKVNFLSENKDKISALLIASLDEIYMQIKKYFQEYVINKDVFKLDEDELFKNQLEAAKKSIYSYVGNKDQDYLSVIIHRCIKIFRKAIKANNQEKKEAGVEKENITQNLNRYLNLCYLMITKVCILEDYGIDEKVIVGIVDLVKQINNYYNNIANINFRANLLKFSLTKLIQGYLYVYINDHMKKFLKKGEIKKAKEFLDYYETFNTKAGLGETEINNVIKNNDIDIDETIKKIKTTQPYQVETSIEQLRGSLLELTNNLISLSDRSAALK